MALTLLPMLGVVLYRTMLMAFEKPRVFLQVTLAMLPLNASVNFVLMTGVGPAPALGIAGAGNSSLVVATVSLAVLIFVARQAGTGAGSAPVDWLSLVAVLRVGLPVGITAVAEVGVFLGATVYAATLGAADVAARTLALRTAGVSATSPCSEPSSWPASGWGWLRERSPWPCWPSERSPLHTVSLERMPPA